MDFGKGHAEFVAQAPETGEEDGACEEVVLVVWFLEHDGKVVLDQAAGSGHGVFGEGTCGDVEGFVGKKIVDAGRSRAEEGGVTLREVVAST